MASSIKANLIPQIEKITKTYLNAKLNSAESILEEIEVNNYTINDVKESLKAEIKIIKQIQKEQGIK